MNINPGDISAFIIVIKGDEKSEYYYNYVKDSWEKHGFNLQRFDAITPGNIPDDIEFGKYNQSTKYTAFGIKKIIPESEKAAFFSHFKLWKHIANTNTYNNIIIEHDAYLEDFDLFKREWEDKKTPTKFFGLGASCYRIHPVVCKHIVNVCKHNLVESGPMSYTADAAFNMNMFTYDLTFPKLGGEWNLPVRHVYNEEMGNTIDHYSDLDPEWKIKYQNRSKQQNRKKWVFIGE